MRVSQRHNKYIEKWLGKRDPGIRMGLHGQKKMENSRGKRRKPNLKTLRAS